MKTPAQVKNAMRHLRALQTHHLAKVPKDAKRALSA
jgi:hypothetical protein